MAHSKILDKSASVLVIVDIQEAFRPVISDFPAVASRTAMAVKGFGILGVPVIVTEQYPKGLGRTSDEILLALPGSAEVIEKSSFSACGADAFVSRLNDLKARQVVLGGLEAHICVNQTAHDLLDRGFEVHLLLDCVASRYTEDRNAGLQKMHASGVVSTSVEMALFELMRDSRQEQFKEIQNLIK
jgi:nicotinamidase-related amidase